MVLQAKRKSVARNENKVRNVGTEYLSLTKN